MLQMVAGLVSFELFLKLVHELFSKLSDSRFSCYQEGKIELLEEKQVAGYRFEYYRAI
jgi:hypothetical protein